MRTRRAQPVMVPTSRKPDDVRRGELLAALRAPLEEVCLTHAARFARSRYARAHARGVCICRMALGGGVCICRIARELWCAFAV